MCRWVSVAVLLAALIVTDVAAAEPPADVYSDYAADGVLNCGHSRAALKGVLNDASIHQYGDPLTLLGLKLAVRKQLAGGCRREESAAPGTGSAGGGDGGAPTEGSGGEAGERETSGGEAGERETSGEPKSSEPKDSSSSGAEPQTDAVVNGPTSNVQDGRMVLLGIVLLLLTLGSGGWAARRAFSD